MNTLIIYLDQCIKDAQRADYNTRTAFDHAFGAVMYHQLTHPNDSYPLAKLWEKVYRPQFEKMMYPETSATLAEIDRTSWRKNPGNAFI